MMTLLQSSGPDQSARYLLPICGAKPAKKCCKFWPKLKFRSIPRQKLPSKELSSFDVVWCFFGYIHFVGTNSSRPCSIPKPHFLQPSFDRMLGFEVLIHQSIFAITVAYSKKKSTPIPAELFLSSSVSSSRSVWKAWDRRHAKGSTTNLGPADVVCTPFVY